MSQLKSVKAKIPIWIDCDPGNDDAVALLVSLFNENFNFVGVSTVYGNSTIDNTTHNALAILTALGKNVPVYKGRDVPLKAIPKHAHHIHGTKGIGGFELLPKSTFTIAGEENDFLENLKNKLIEYDGELSIVAIGPLTNISIFFEKFPELRKSVKFLSIMGGAVSERTWKIGCFNVTSDPEAGKAVLEDEILRNKTILIPSDLTHLAIASLEVQKAIISTDTKLRKLFYEIIMCFAENYAKNKGFIDGPPVHDPLAVLVLLQMYDIDHTIGFKFKRYNLKVIVDHKTDSGRVYLDEKNDTTGAYIGYNLDVDNLWKVVLKAFDIADSVAEINK